MPTSLPLAAALPTTTSTTVCRRYLIQSFNFRLVDEDEQATAFQLSEHKESLSGGTSGVG